MVYYKLRLKKRRKEPLRVFLVTLKGITTPLLAQVVGQFGFNMLDFLNLFNKESIIYYEGIKVPVSVYLLRGKQFLLQINNCFSSYYLKFICGIHSFAKQSYMDLTIVRNIFSKKHQ